MISLSARIIILAALLAIAFSSAADARTRGFFALPEVDDEVLVVVTIGPDVRGNDAITVDPRTGSDTYRIASASAPHPRNRRREANTAVINVLDRAGFAAFECIPLALPARLGDTYALYMPYRDGKADPSAIKNVPMPKFARRAVLSLIDTSTGEISWADE